MEVNASEKKYGVPYVHEAHTMALVGVKERNQDVEWGWHVDFECPIRRSSAWLAGRPRAASATGLHATMNACFRPEEEQCALRLRFSR